MLFKFYVRVKKRDGKRTAKRRRAERTANKQILLPCLPACIACSNKQSSPKQSKAEPAEEKLSSLMRWLGQLTWTHTIRSQQSRTSPKSSFLQAICLQMRKQLTSFRGAHLPQHRKKWQVERHCPPTFPIVRVGQITGFERDDKKQGASLWAIPSSESRVDCSARM